MVKNNNIPIFINNKNGNIYLLFIVFFLYKLYVIDIPITNNNIYLISNNIYFESINKSYLYTNTKQDNININT